MNESFEDALGYMVAHESGDAEEVFFDRMAWCELIVRLRAAHERAMVQTAERIALSKSEKFESMEKMIPRLKATIKKIVDDNSRLRDALKPVLECDVDFDPRSWMGDSLDNDQMDAVENMHNAVREAQRIAKEGGVE